MQFVFKKLVAFGEPMYEFVGMSGMIKNSKLPYDYLNEDGAHVRLNTSGSNMGIVYTDYISEQESYLYPGDVISKEQYDEFVAISHMAGERLYRIRMLSRWHGFVLVEV